jgi:hypothetical protein
MTSQTTYSVIVRNPNSWTQDRDGSNREYEITAHCGHNHKSEAAAELCMAKLTAGYCVCGEKSTSHTYCPNSGRAQHNADSTSAKWYHATVEQNA